MRVELFALREWTGVHLVVHCAGRVQSCFWILLRVFLFDLFVGPLVLRVLVSYPKRIRDSVHLFMRQRLRLLVDEPMRVLVLFLPARHIDQPK